MLSVQRIKEITVGFVDEDNEIWTWPWRLGGLQIGKEKRKEGCHGIIEAPVSFSVTEQSRGTTCSKWGVHFLGYSQATCKKMQLKENGMWACNFPRRWETAYQEPRKLLHSSVLWSKFLYQKEMWIF